VIRTHDAGSLRAEHAGQTVTLAGWVARRRDHGGVAFLDLREASGVVQVVVRDEEVAHHLRSEYCLKVTGQVATRPEGNANPHLPTGEIEVIANDVEVLSSAAPLPFPIDEHVQVGEEVRLKHRYLDLRREGPASALRLRSKVNRAARQVLDARDFVEIETPTLTRSTPEGARDFLVPARLQPGSWYALPQSPQLFKQLLMVGGMERYYQIARCYRDEDFRADRQPEFTQLDLEMSFVEQDDVIALAEEILKAVWATIGVEIQTPIERMTYEESMRRFGTDKPDLRMGLELVECTEFFQDTPFRVSQAPYVGAVVMPGGASQPRKQLDAWQEWAKQRGAKGLAYVLVGQDGELGGPVAKNLSETERAGITEHVGAAPGDAIFFAAGPGKHSRGLLGAARLDVFLRDNTDLLEVHLGVHPDEQHRGHGRRLVEAVEHRAAELGRHQVVGAVQEPPDGSENRAMRFAAAAGARRALGEMRRVLDLTTLSGDHLARLRAEAEEKATGYRLVTWAGPVPDAHVEGYARLLGRIMADAPQGDLDLEASVWDADRVRQREALLASQGRRSVAALARVGEGGPLVAYSDVGVSSYDPDNAFQWDTLVQPEHRGHRLGLLVKVAVLDLLRTEAPRSRYLHTWNADDNGYMIAINDKLGFRPAQRESAWRLDLPR